MKGLFITFEGIEGCGKSTQAGFLSDYLLSKGRKVVMTREPGGTDLGNAVRKLILDSGHVYPVAELLLFLADRNQHIREIILPALGNGITVICDRFYHSTFAYQIGGRKLDPDLVITLNNASIEGLKPDITFLLDIPAETGFERKKKSDMKLDRIEKETLDFHKSIRHYYLKLAESDKIIKLLDGSQDKEIILAQIKEITDRMI